MSISGGKDKRFFGKVEENPIHNRTQVIISCSEEGTLYSSSQNMPFESYMIGIFYFYYSRELLAI